MFVVVCRDSTCTASVLKVSGRLEMGRAERRPDRLEERRTARRPGQRPGQRIVPDGIRSLPQRSSGPRRHQGLAGSAARPPGPGHRPAGNHPEGRRHDGARGLSGQERPYRDYWASRNPTRFPAVGDPFSDPGPLYRRRIRRPAARPSGRTPPAHWTRALALARALTVIEFRPGPDSFDAADFIAHNGGSAVYAAAACTKLRPCLRWWWRKKRAPDAGRRRQGRVLDSFCCGD